MPGAFHSSSSRFSQSSRRFLAFSSCFAFEDLEFQVRVLERRVEVLVRVIEGMVEGVGVREGLAVVVGVGVVEIGCVVEDEEFEEEREGRPIARRKRSFSGMVVVLL